MTARELAPLLSVGALAEYLGVTDNTIYGWNSKGTGPRYLRVGKHVRYAAADVQRWLDGQAARQAGLR